LNIKDLGSLPSPFLLPEIIFSQFRPILKKQPQHLQTIKHKKPALKPG
jgi:hypothetical protein